MDIKEVDDVKITIQVSISVRRNAGRPLTSGINTSGVRSARLRNIQVGSIRFVCRASEMTRALADSVVHTKPGAHLRHGHVGLVTLFDRKLSSPSTSMIPQAHVRGRPEASGLGHLRHSAA